LDTLAATVRAGHRSSGVTSIGRRLSLPVAEAFHARESIALVLVPGNPLAVVGDVVPVRGGSLPLEGLAALGTFALLLEGLLALLEEVDDTVARASLQTALDGDPSTDAGDLVDAADACADVNRVYPGWDLFSSCRTTPDSPSCT